MDKIKDRGAKLLGYIFGGTTASNHNYQHKNEGKIGLQ
jgi:hypothetical protein